MIRDFDRKSCCFLPTPFSIPLWAETKKVGTQCIAEEKKLCRPPSTHAQSNFLSFFLRFIVKPGSKLARHSLTSQHGEVPPQGRGLLTVVFHFLQGSCVCVPLSERVLGGGGKSMERKAQASERVRMRAERVEMELGKLSEECVRTVGFNVVFPKVG